ncbi:MAG: trypsin-like peptidase domain-containing protein [Terrimicrobiaceae bacterium]|nr:trypsin-like peptidase domain-containing protein [Terrimicrobiaceae bacterium]
MRSLLRFLLFIAVLGLVLAVVILLRERTAPAAAGAPAAPSALEAADHEFTSLVAAVLPSVVSIDALPPEAVDPRAHLFKLLMGMPPGQVLPQLGSGVIVSPEGHVVTNFHVIERAGAVRVHLSDGRTLPARFLGGDQRSDVAILKVEAGGLEPARWGDSDAVRIGQKIFAVGNPLGLQETVTQGIISGKGRRDLGEAGNEFFQTDAAINPGNSGGPLFNVRGEMVGVANMVAAGGEGVAFAIPSNTVRRVFESIRDHGRFIRGWFGALVRPLTPQLAGQLGLAEPRGALILGAYENSPAQAAGLRAGDVIVEFNGRPIRDHIDLRNRVAECEVGRPASIRFIREGRELEARAVIAPEPSPGP